MVGKTPASHLSRCKTTRKRATKVKTDSITLAKATLAVTVAAARGIVSEKEDLVVVTDSGVAGEDGVIGLEEVEEDLEAGDFADGDKAQCRDTREKCRVTRVDGIGFRDECRVLGGSVISDGERVSREECRVSDKTL